MRTAFLLLIIIHGAIHLLGFLKAYKLGELKELSSTPITKPVGLLWLLTSMLFWTYAILNLIEFEKAWIIGLISLIISQFLIIYFWRKAKFGTLPNLVILIAVLFSYGNLSFNKLTEKETLDILSRIEHNEQTILSDNVISGLPTPIQKWLIKSDAIGKNKIQVGRVKQNALMKMQPDQKNWYRANALQYTTIDIPAFIWTVDVDMNRFLKFRGRDKFVDGKGEMLIKLNSLINIVNEQGEKLNEGTIQRYLGEMVWFPSMAVSPHITWEQIDEYTAKATMTYKGTSGSGTFNFNEEGDFVNFTALRFKGNDPDAKRYKWIIAVDEYKVFEGIKVPAKMKATWKLEEGDWTWLKLEITDIKYNENAHR